MAAINGTRLLQPWQALQRWLLPLRCLLCGAPGEHGADLCADCAAELPRNRSCCARCALPLAMPAALCGECQRHPPPWDAAWAPFRYGWPLDRLESRFKFGRDLAAGRVLSTLWRREPCPIDLPQLLLAAQAVLLLLDRVDDRAGRRRRARPAGVEPGVGLRAAGQQGEQEEKDSTHVRISAG